MILDSPSLIQLPIGVDRIIPQAEDSQVVIPSIINPTIEPRSSGLTFLGGGTGVVATQACIVILTNTRTNVASGVLNIVILGKGYWEVTLNVASRANFTALPTALADVVLRITQVGSGLSMHLLPIYATVGSNVVAEKIFRALLAESYQIDVLLGITGVGQTLDTHISVGATRIL